MPTVGAKRVEVLYGKGHPGWPDAQPVTGKTTASGETEGIRGNQGRPDRRVTERQDSLTDPAIARTAALWAGEFAREQALPERGKSRRISGYDGSDATVRSS